jgi:transcriptional regulator with XRE-family HTH domain
MIVPVSFPRAHGPIVRALRIAQGRQAVDLATAVGMDTAYLSRVEHGRRRPLAHWTPRLAKALGVPPEVLTGQRPVLPVLRELAGVTARQFAADTGITVAHLADLEAGHELPDPALAAVLATRLHPDVPAAALCTRPDEATDTAVAS